jgi:sugar lactone lactonase YvrE
MTARIFDPTPCTLGEGPLWHPKREQFFWFDIAGCQLLTRPGDETGIWPFDEHVSAAGWVDETHLLIASETRLFQFDLDTGATEDVAPLEADKPHTRSNDGRADPYGGFWIGTMSKTGEPEQGAIYRYYKGEVRLLYPDISVSNAICFATHGGHAYFTDTLRKTVWRQDLDGEGWPKGEPDVYLDLNAAGLLPDGAVVDAEGRFWCAMFGAACVMVFDEAGTEIATHPINAESTTCPAFGGAGLTDLYVTSARHMLDDATLADGRPHGATFIIEGVGQGQAEHQVIL